MKGAIMIYTIGFTKKTAEQFLRKLENAKVDVVLDIRLNNTSQLASFAKYPDLPYFLKTINNCDYIHDIKFAPTDSTLKAFKKKEIDWSGYLIEFNDTLAKRNIASYISEKYIELKDKNICLLCSEDKHIECHRSIIAEYFKKEFGTEVKHI